MPSPLPGWQAGILASVAYTLEQEVDLRLLDYDADDLFLIGGLVTTNRRRGRLIGLVQHLLTGAVLGEVYARFASRFLPGTPLQKGLTFLMVENVAGFSLVPFLQPFHPRIAEGSLPPWWHWRSFVQATLRHLAFGLVLGATSRVGERSATRIHRSGNTSHTRH